MCVCEISCNFDEFSTFPSLWFPVLANRWLFSSSSLICLTQNLSKLYVTELPSWNQVNIARSDHVCTCVTYDWPISTRILDLQVTSLPPCWWTITKDSSLASIVSSTNMLVPPTCLCYLILEGLIASQESATQAMRTACELWICSLWKWIIWVLTVAIHFFWVNLRLNRPRPQPKT